MKERIIYISASVVVVFVLLVVVSVYSAIKGADRIDDSAITPGETAMQSAAMEYRGDKTENTTAALTRGTVTAPLGRRTVEPSRSAANEPARRMSREELMEAAYQRRRQRAEEMGMLEEFEKAEAEKQALRAERKARGEAARQANREKRLSNKNGSAEKRLKWEQMRAEREAERAVNLN